LAIAYDATRATRDLDAVFVPTDMVRQAALAVAEREGLTEDWLNDAVKGFLPGPGQRTGQLACQQVTGAQCQPPLGDVVGAADPPAG